MRGERIAPVTVDLALTRACNMRCVYCYSQLQKNPGPAWSKRMIEETFQDFADLGVKAVSLVSDGESTCSPLWPAAIIRANSLDLDVAIGTNGILFTPNVPILSALTYVRFNLSAGTPEGFVKIHRVPKENFDRVLKHIRQSVEIKHRYNLKVTVGVQMVFNAWYKEETIPLVSLAKGLGVDYIQIKHCSDDEDGTLGIDMKANAACEDVFKQAESFQTDEFQVIVKRKKIMSCGVRKYKQCYAPPFHLQISGSGLVAPCGMFFASKYEKFHIGSLHETRFRDLWSSAAYWDVMDFLASPAFNAQKMCGCLCLQDATNEYLNDLVQRGVKEVQKPEGLTPEHVNFI